MRRLDARLVGAVAAIALLIAGWAAATGALIWSELGAAERETLAGALAGHLPLAIVTWLAATALAAAAVHRAFGRYVAAPARLLDEARTLVGAGAGTGDRVGIGVGADTRVGTGPGTGSAIEPRLEPGGSREIRALAELIGALAAQRTQLERDMRRQVLEASRGIEQERSRLAALMSELAHGVVVCNIDGRILLYNARARAEYRALSQAPAMGGGAELVGLGRSIYNVFDQRLVEHALEGIRERMRRGEASPSAQFVMATRGGQLLRVSVAPVRAVGGGDAGAASGEAGGTADDLHGFVLMLENITRQFEAEELRDRLLHGLTEGTRASLGSLQAAVEMLDYPDLDAAMRERFLGVIRDELRAMGGRLSALATEAAAGLRSRWPLEDMRGADLVSAAARRIEAAGGPRASAGDVDEAVWLRVDSFSLLQALAYLALRLGEEFEVRSVRLRLAAAGPRHAHLDLVWSGTPISTETVVSWELDAMRIGADRSTLTVREVVERHGGEFWFERERARHEALFRFLLPLASAQEPQDPSRIELLPGDARPEFYDFDLFGASDRVRALDDRPLAQLAFTVFDTETTGLNPSAGDEILQIGAVRIVNGKLLRQERFEQLVDPRRPIPDASIPIHGITPDMVRGMPTIGEVLPAFHAFAQDTVLVAHNAAFDMRFLQLKEAATGVRFEQPVLDTLLLAAVVHPSQESHALEKLAERFGLVVSGRHTASGDAILAAEIFLKLLPLLAGQGIVTLGQAREAARQTYYARLKY